MSSSGCPAASGTKRWFLSSRSRRSSSRAAARPRASPRANVPPGTSGGHFGRALSAPTVPRRTSKPAAAKASKGRRKVKKAGKTRKTDSKYKSRALAERTVHTYRFNEYGEPLSSSAKAKSSAKKKARKSSSLDDAEDKPGACTTDSPCTVNNHDADAL